MMGEHGGVNETSKKRRLEQLRGESPRITDEQANALAVQDGWPLGDTTITQALMWLGADLLDARSWAAVQRAKVAMYERWMREHTPSCPLLSENIVEPPPGLSRQPIEPYSRAVCHRCSGFGALPVGTGDAIHDPCPRCGGSGVVDAD